MDPACGAAAVSTLLARGVSFSALIASNDDMAIGAIKQLHECGVSVPEQVSVAGFDDIARLLRYSVAGQRQDAGDRNDPGDHQSADRHGGGGGARGAALFQLASWSGAIPSSACWSEAASVLGRRGGIR